MKKTDTVTKIISLMLFLVLMAYLGLYLYRSLAQPTQTALVISMTLRETGSASGLVFRDEDVKTSAEKYTDVTVADGSKVAAGAVLAVTFSGDAALERANRITELEMEIARIESALAENNSAMDLVTRENATTAAVAKLSAAVSRHDLSAVGDCAAALSSLVLDSGGGYTDEAQLAALRFELEGLRTSTIAGATEIVAEKGGVFSSIVDGFESLDPDELGGLTPSALYKLMDSDAQMPDGAIGKLIYGIEWYYAAVMTETEAALLTVGSKVELDFGRYYGASLSAAVRSLGRVVSGERVVVFALNSALADTLAMRQATAEILFSEMTGVRVPKAALHHEEAGTCVYILTGMQAERRAVEVIHEGEDYVLVTSAYAIAKEAFENADPSDPNSISPTVAASKALKPGNEVIVNSGELYDGKIMN